MTPEEVWPDPVAWISEAGERVPVYDRTAMEAYAAEKVAEAFAAEPTEAMVDAGVRAISWSRNDRNQVTDIYRAMQAANQHHGGNDADIPQEVREAAMTDHERFITAVAYDCGYQAGLAAGKRAGMERAAEIAEDAHNAPALRWAPKAIAQAIRSELEKGAT